MPKRIQRKRTKGWRMPDGTVYVGRPTKWGNPFKAGEKRSPFTAVSFFDLFIAHTDEGMQMAENAREELRGKDLACWCPVEAEYCHADVLLEIANK